MDRSLSVLYVENDPALRGLIATFLRDHAAIAEVFECESGEKAISFAEHRRPDVALIDIALGKGSLDGVATGTELRRINEHIGIVLYSQLPQETVAGLVNFSKREAWSYIPKRADMKIDEMVDVLCQTAGGKSVNLGDSFDSTTNSSSPLAPALSQRQHVVLALLATGVEPRHIAEQLNISFDSVRKDLSNAYAILVPNPKPGSDLRVSSILAYQRLMNAQLNHVD